MSQSQLAKPGCGAGVLSASLTDSTRRCADGQVVLSDRKHLLATRVSFVLTDYDADDSISHYIIEKMLQAGSQQKTLTVYCLNS